MLFEYILKICYYNIGNLIHLYIFVRYIVVFIYVYEWNRILKYSKMIFIYYLVDILLFLLYFLKLDISFCCIIRGFYGKRKGFGVRFVYEYFVWYLP